MKILLVLLLLVFIFGPHRIAAEATQDFDVLPDDVIQEMFPMKVNLGPYPGPRWSVEVRVQDDNWSRVVKFFLVRKRDGRVAVRLDHLITDKLRDQINTLVEAHPDHSARAIAEMIQVQRHEIDSAKCPALLEIASEFERLQLRIAPVLSDAFIIHASTYEIFSMGTGSNSVYFALQGYGPDSTEQPVPIISWTERAIRAFSEECKTREASAEGRPPR